MKINTTEAFGPEELAELGSLFDDLQTSAGTIARTDEEKAELAILLLRLYGLRQLERDQITRVALRLMRESSSEATDSPLMAAGGTPNPSRTSPDQNP